MTSNLINRLCLFSPALLTVTRDEQQNKQAAYSKSAVEVGCVWETHNQIACELVRGWGGKPPATARHPISLCVHKTFIRVALWTAKLRAAWAQAWLTSRIQDSEPYLLPSSCVKYFTFVFRLSRGSTRQQQGDIGKPSDHKQWLPSLSPYPVLKEICFGAASGKAGTTFLKAGWQMSLTKPSASRRTVLLTDELNKNSSEHKQHTVSGASQQRWFKI